MKSERDWEVPNGDLKVHVEPLNRKDFFKMKNKGWGSYFEDIMKTFRRLHHYKVSLQSRVSNRNRIRYLNSEDAIKSLEEDEPRRAFSKEIRFLAEKKYGERSWKQCLGRDAHLSAETIRKIDTLETLYPQRESIYVILLALGIEPIEKAELLFQMSGFSRYTDPEALVEKIVFDCIKERRTLDECFERLEAEGYNSNLTGILRRDDAQESDSISIKKKKVSRRK